MKELSPNGLYGTVKPLDISTFCSSAPQCHRSEFQNASSTEGDVSDEQPVPFPIAIVGMAMRLPGGVTCEQEFWDLLVNKRDGHCKVPENRYNIDAFYKDPEQGHVAGSIRTKSGYFLQQDIGRVDAGFFGISKLEAAKLDPQQRLLLEVVWECMQNGGQTQWMGKNIGCYVGVFGEDWLDLMSKDIQANDRFRVVSAGDFAIANRVSYEYDLRGPSIAFRTGCSSSLVGLHEACQALYSGECSSAIVAGTNLILTPTMTVSMSDNMVISPSGICRTFDAAADGYGRGEAVNAIFIKPLDAAIRDGDPVRAIIRSTAVNCDGKTPSITTPGSEAQEKLVRRAYRKAGIADIEKTGFFECHGTGTIVGDTAETSVVAKIFGREGIHIGAVKPNVGHSEGASGITSVIKSVLALENKTIPPNIFFDAPNPNIPWVDAKLQVPVKAIPWPSDRYERISVNSFGIGGTNAHLILDSASAAACQSAADTTRCQGSRMHLLVVSGKTPSALKGNIQAIENYNEQNPAAARDLAFTLALKRDYMPYRAFAVSGEDGKHSPFESGHSQSPETYFVFTGQGAQWTGMGRELLVRSKRFRDDIRSMDSVLQRLENAPDWSIEDQLSKCDDADRFREAKIAQPLCTALQIALVNLLCDWGVKPTGVIGHSSGEIAAAYASGAIPMAMAIKIAYLRGQVLDTAKPNGAMAAVGLGPTEVQELLGSGVVVACENSPESVTISGDRQEVESVLEELQTREIFCRRLAVDVAYHSHLMKGLGEALNNTLCPHIVFNGSMVPFFSTVTNEVVSDPTYFQPSYWGQNLESPVLFHTAVERILDSNDKPKLFVEIGPHSSLFAPLRQIFSRRAEKARPGYASALARGKDQWNCILSLAGRLYIHGVPVTLSKLCSPGKTLTNLPPYCWDHSERYWSETRAAHDWRLRKAPQHELLGCRTMESTDIEPSWRNLLHLDNVLWILDHKLSGEVVYPCAAYVAMLGEAMRQISGSRDYSIRNLYLRTALILSSTDPAPVEIITDLRMDKIADNVDSGWYDFVISACQKGTWRKHCVGQIRSGAVRVPVTPEIRSYTRHVESEKWYTLLQAKGLEYGPSFRGLQDITANPSGPNATASIHDGEELHRDEYALHPIVIDQCLQLLSVAATQGIGRRMTKLCIPTAIESLYVAPGRGKMLANVSCDMAGSTINGSAQLVAGGEVVLSLQRGVFFGLSDSALGEPPALLFSSIDWKPHLDFVPLEKQFPPIPGGLLPRNYTAKLTGLVIIEMFHRSRKCEPGEPHLKKYHQWLGSQYEKMCHNEAALLPEMRNLSPSDPRSRWSEIQEIVASGLAPACLAFYELAERILLNIEDLLGGKIHSLHLLEEDGGLSRLYERHLDVTRWDDFLQLLSHAKPKLRILEIGGGTGGATSTVLKALNLGRNHRGRMYSKYTFTDISGGFIAQAKEKFKDYCGLAFGILDISQDAVQQGFDQGGYDLIIASNVLHATPCISETLENVRKLLAPDGHLLFQEICNVIPAIDLVMGVFPGWWLAEDGREQPYLTPEAWNTKLIEAGFTGVEIIQYDNDVPYHFNASMMSRVRTDTIALNAAVEILHGGEISGWGRTLERQLLSSGFHVGWRTLGDLTEPVTNVISLLDSDGPFFHNLSNPDFLAFQQFVQKIKGSFLWITKPVQTPTASIDPRFGLTLGVIRTVRQEILQNAGTLEVDRFDDAAAQVAVEVFHKFTNQAQMDEQWHDHEYEFVLLDGVIHVSRFQWSSMGDVLRSGEVLGPRSLDIGCPGVLDSLTWAIAETQPPSLGPAEVEVDIKFVGLNFRDIMISMGLLGDPNELGLEATGIVCAIGSAVKSLKVGDHVCTATPGSLRTRKVLPVDSLYTLPGELSLEEAAASATVFATAIYSLIHVGNLRRGQSILIHSACGGVGLAAIQIAQLIGAELFVTVGSQEKREHLINTCNIAEDHIFDSRSTSFLPHLLEATKDRGVDIVLNSLSGELLHASWNCVAPYGKMIELGKRDILGHGKLDMSVFAANRTFYGVDLHHINQENPQLLREILTQFVQYIEAGTIRPIQPITTFDAGSITKAFRYMQSGQHIGKVVIRMPDDPSALKVAMVQEKCTLFRRDASYLIVGGFGGLGRAVITWMVERGARHIIVLSRTGQCSPENTAFVEDLQTQPDVQVIAIAGNANNIEDTRRAIRSAPRPIAGIIQMSMVLQDRQLDQMTYEEWMMVLSPKVQGTWNLHNASEGLSMDFFILFSSLTGTCGRTGQMNYAAANTFLDAFMRYRRSKGLPANVIDVGFMGDIGFVSQNLPKVLGFARSSSWQILEEKDLLQALELAVIQDLPQFHLGLGSTKPLAEMANTPPWGHDARFSAWNNAFIAQTETAPGNGEGIKELMASIKRDPSLLDKQSTEDQITYEAGRMIASHMSYPEDMDLDELAAIAIDSLMTIEIRNWFRRHVRIEISLVEITNAGTVRGLSQTAIRIIREKHSSGELEKTKEALGNGKAVEVGLKDDDEVCLYTNDRKLGQDMQPILNKAPHWYSEAEGCVFLTGATGYLGAFFLTLIVGLPEVKEVICLTRAPDSDTGKSRIQECLVKYSLSCDFQSKVVVVPGDVTDAMLGMGQECFEYFAQRSSVVFHFAAYANYTLPYSSHRDTNVLGTLHVLHFANTKRLKPVHYASSISACGISGVVAGQLIPEDARPEFDMTYLKEHIGYTQSKVVAESIVWNAMSKGLPITIHRPGFVSGHSVTGICKSEDFLNRLMSNCIRIGCYPSAPIARNQCVPVDFVCSAIMQLSLTSSNLGHAFNIVQPDQTQTLTWQETMNIVSKFTSPPLRHVSVRECIREFAEHGEERARGGAAMLEEKFSDSMIFWGLDGSNMALYETSNLKKALSEFPDLLDLPPMSKLLGIYFPVWAAAQK